MDVNRKGKSTANLWHLFWQNVVMCGRHHQIHACLETPVCELHKFVARGETDIHSADIATGTSALRFKATSDVGEVSATISNHIYLIRKRIWQTPNPKKTMAEKNHRMSKHRKQESISDEAATEGSNDKEPV